MYGLYLVVTCVFLVVMWSLLFASRVFFDTICGQNFFGVVQITDTMEWIQGLPLEVYFVPTIETNTYICDKQFLTENMLPTNM